MSDPYTPPTTQHLGLPLPSPNAPSQQADIGRIAAALTSLDTAWSALVEALAGKSDTGHGHAIGGVAGLVEALAGKSDAGHGHGIAAVTGLVEALAGKAAMSHGHGAADVYAAVKAILAAGTNVSVTPADGQYRLTIGAAGATVSTEEVQDIVAAMLQCTDGTVVLTYDDAAGTLTVSQPAGYTHWRVMPTVEVNGAPNVWECYEFRLYATTGSTTNLCTGGTPICNPQGTSIANAFDGNSATPFQSGLTSGNANTAYIGYRFPSRKEVHKLEFATGHAQTTAATCVIQSGNDGVLWSPVATISMISAWSTQTFTW